MIDTIYGTDDSQERLRFLGKRVERIIFLGIIFSLVSIAVYLFAAEIKKKSVDDINLGIESMQKCVLDKKAEIVEKYNRYLEYSKYGPLTHPSVYSMKVCFTDLLMKKNSDGDDPNSYYRAYKAMEKYFDKVQPLPYDDIDPFLTKIREEVFSEPLKVRGVELDNKVEIAPLGIPIRTDITSLFSNFGYVYFAILFLWFIGLKRSRIIELFAIKNDAHNYSWVYPHLLNNFNYDIKRDRSLHYNSLKLEGKQEFIFLNNPKLLSRTLYLALLISFTFGPFFAAVITISTSEYSLWHLIGMLQFVLYFFIALYIEDFIPSENFNSDLESEVKNASEQKVESKSIN